MISWDVHAVWLVLATILETFHNLSEDRHLGDVIFSYVLLFYHIKQIDSLLPWVCSVKDYRQRQNVVRTSVTHSVAPGVPPFLLLPHWTSPVIHYWGEARQHGVYLLSRLFFSLVVAIDWPTVNKGPFVSNYINVRLWKMAPPFSNLSKKSHNRVMMRSLNYVIVTNRNFSADKLFASAFAFGKIKICAPVINHDVTHHLVQ